MNYRHGYHAGNFADVVKHAIVAMILDHLKEKDKGFCVLDTHAGAGRYDLSAEAAAKTGEWRDGIGRLWGRADLPPELAPYLAAIRRLNRAGVGTLRWYPGSPRLVRILMRPQDRLVACELHPAEAQALHREFAGDARVRVARMDGYQALKAHLPPAERRGLVLVDPPFEERDEFERMLKGLNEARRRWAQGVFAFWYPIKDHAATASFHKSVVDLGVKRVIAAEVLVRPATDPERLNGAGLLLVNPPWTLADDLVRLLPRLADAFQDPGPASARIERLAGE
jgi:23S rRNA (adenine2030-N6)-methyltransferase